MWSRQAGKGAALTATAEVPRVVEQATEMLVFSD